MNRKLCITLAALACASLLGACNKESKSSGAKAATTVSAGAVSSKCPCGAPSDGKTYSMYNGTKVGFCCTKCQAKWDAMGDSAKAADIAKMSKSN